MLRLSLNPPFPPPVVSHPTFLSRPLAGHGLLIRSGEAGAGRDQAVSPPGRYPRQPLPLVPLARFPVLHRLAVCCRWSRPAHPRAGKLACKPADPAAGTPGKSPASCFGAPALRKRRGARLGWQAGAGPDPLRHAIRPRAQRAAALQAAPRRHRHQVRGSRGAVGIALPLVARIRSGVELVPPTA